MNSKFRSKIPSPSVACFAREDELKTFNGLALTPSEMERLTKQGIPITTNNIQDQYFDGEKNPSFDVPIERGRGIDINDVWERGQDIRNKFISAHNNDVAKYGE